MTAQSLSLNIQRGEYWQRVVAPRDARTHWPAPSTQATAFMANITGASVGIPTSIQVDGSILLVLDEAATTSLADGQYYFEVSSNPYLPYYNLGGLSSPYPPRVQKVAIGTINVTTEDYTDFLANDPSTTPDIPNGLPDIIGGAPA